MAGERFNWMVLQSGQLPLRPDRRIDPEAEHRCTSVLVWPTGAEPALDNTVIADPCFTSAGYDHALVQLKTLNLTLSDIGRVFVTHLHGDHMLHLPHGIPVPRLRALRASDTLQWPGVALIPCPGHDPLLLALAIMAADGRALWIVGDAVLDEEWLRTWGYYWPNQYSPADVVETWRSVAKIVAGAAIIVPGHGPMIEVTVPLVRDLLICFVGAPYAGQCQDVAESLRTRLANLSGDGV
jgi:glyoxylase-like metal-dependent hydrolase (beta-lactamase superfamily II)